MSAPVKYVGPDVFAKMVVDDHFHRPPKVWPAALFENPCQINGMAKYATGCVFHPRIAAMEKLSQLNFSPVAAP